MTTAKLVIPSAVDDRTRRVVKQRAADEFGGWTTYDVRGGWVDDDDGDLVEETSEVVEVHGAGETWAKSTAGFIQDKSDQDTVLWSVEETTWGLE